MWVSLLHLRSGIKAKDHKTNCRVISECRKFISEALELLAKLRFNIRVGFQFSLTKIILKLKRVIFYFLRTLARPRLPTVRSEARQRLGGRYPRHHRHRRSHPRAHRSQGHTKVSIGIIKDARSEALVAQTG